MPEPWYPSARRNPGIRAGYTLGVINPMDTVKCHYTVGTNSDDLIRRAGLAQFLVTRSGEVVQYAEANAQCIDSGEWNDDGPGVEIEYYPPQDGDEIFTAAARAACGPLVQWLHSEWGIPLTYYDGPRIRENTFRGFIAHRALIQSQPHSDFWPQEDWDAMTAPAPAPPGTTEEEDDMWIARDTSTLLDWLVTANGMTVAPESVVFDLVAAGVRRADVPTATVQWLGQNLKP